MANGLFPTGVSRQPLDVATAGQNFLQAAVEQKLANIEAEREQVSESEKNVLKAMSIKTLDGLSRSLQNKYQKEIQDYRSKVVETYKNKGGKLDLDDKTSIQNGFVDLQQRQLSDIAALKERAKARELITDPNFPYGFDAQSAVNEMVKWDKAMERGEYLGDPVAMVMQHRKQPELGDYIDKVFGVEVASLDVESLAGIEGNIFTQTELSGLNVKAEKSLNKAKRIRDRILADPNVQSQYRNPDGTIDEVRLAETRQRVEDTISGVIKKQSFQRTSFGSGSNRDYAYTNFEPYDIPISTDTGEIETTSYASVPLTGMPKVNFNGQSVAFETIEWVPVAKDEKKYKNVVGEIDMDRPAWQVEEEYSETGGVKPRSKYNIIPNEYLSQFSPSEFEKKPFLKMASPKNKDIPWRNVDDLYSTNNAKIDYAPLYGKEKAAVLGKLQTKRDSYMKAIDVVNQRLEAENKRGRGGVTEYTIPNRGVFTEEELRSAGWTDAELQQLKEMK